MGVFDDLIPAGGAPAPQPSSSPQARQGGGLPMVRIPRSPEQIAEEQRKEQAAILAQQAAARAQNSEDRAQQRWEHEQGKPPAGYTWSPSGGLAPIPGGPADPNRELRDKAVPETAAHRIEEQVGIYSTLKNSSGGFQDDYAGNAWTGGLENTIQSVNSDFGTPGQQQWWANFRATDNLIRNSLFGSALTDHEKRAYEETTISPSMDPKQVRANLEKRTEIIRAALGRRVAYMKANGFKPEAVDALLGEYSADLGPQPVREEDIPAQAPFTNYDPTKTRQDAPIAGASPTSPPSAPTPPAGTDKTASFIMGGDDFTTRGAATGSTYVESDRDRRMNAAVQAILDNGGSVEEANALAQQYGYQPEGGRPIFDAAQWQKAQQYNATAPKGSPRARVQVPQTGVNEVGDIAGTISGIAGSPVGAYFGGAADSLSLGYSDEALSFLQSAGDKTYDEAIAENRLAQTIMREENPGSTLVGQLTGALLLPTKVGGATRTGGIGAGALQAGREGLAYGAAYGSGSAEGGLRERIPAAVQGGVLGGTLGYGSGQVVPRATSALAGYVGNRAPSAIQAERNALLRTADDIGVELLPADVGGTAVRKINSGLMQSPLSAPAITEAAERSTSQLRGATQAAAGRAGTALPEDEAGQLVRGAAERYSKRTSRIGGRLYDRAEQAAQGVTIKPYKAVQAIDAEIARLSETAEAHAPLIKVLQDYRAAIRKANGVSVSGLRDVRSLAGKAAYSDELRTQPTERVMGIINRALSEDIENGLRQAGKPGAVRLFKQADQFWEQRVKQIDEVLQPILGNGRSGEDILKAVEGMTRGQNGGVVRLGRMLRSMPANEAGDIQATIIERLGKANPGAQTAAGDAFSPATFLTNWNKMSDKGKAAMFGGGELRANLDKIAKVAEASKAAQRYSNTSNTAGATNINEMIKSSARAFGALTVAGGSAATVGIVPTALAALANYGGGKLFASQAFTRWLARAPQGASPSVIRQYIDKLPGIAARESAASAEITGLHQYLKAANDNGALRRPAAASTDEKDDGR